MPLGTGSTIARLFAGRPTSLALFRVLRGAIDEIGPATMRATRTQVSFTTLRAFAWVWLPRMWTKKPADDSLTLTFGLGQQVADDRVAEATEVLPSLWTHRIVVDKTADVDAQVRGWLRETYTLSATARGRT